MLLCCLWSESRAQDRQHIFFRYTPDNSAYPDGSMMECFAQEARGILWMGSRNGLARFDGNNFLYFKADAFDSSSISNNNIACLHTEGNFLYAGTYGGGLFVMDLLTLKARPVLLPGESKAGRYSVTMIAPAGKDSFLISTNKLRLLKMHRSNFGTRVISIAGEEQLATGQGFKKCLPALHLQDHVWLLDHEEIVLLNTKTGSFRQQTFDRNSRLLQKKEKINDLSSMYIQNDSIAWIAAFYDGLIEWNYRSGQYHIHSLGSVNGNGNPPYVSDITAYSSAALWLATSHDGIINFDLAAKQFSKEPFFNAGSARTFFKDSNNGTWIAAANELGYYHPWYRGFAKISSPLLQNDDRLLLLKWLSEEETLLATGTKNRAGLLNRLTYETTELKAPATGVAALFSVAMINDHPVLKSVSNDFYTIDKEKQMLQPFFSGQVAVALKSLKVNGMAPVKNGFLFTSSKGVAVMDSVNKTMGIHTKFLHPDSLHSNFFQKPLTDPFGQTWLAGFDGISIYNAAKKTFQQVSGATAKNLNGLAYISGMKLSADGTTMFVATRDKGIFILDTRTSRLLSQYNENNILPNDQLLHVASSNHDSLVWAAAQRSISCINIYTNEIKTWDASNSSMQFTSRGYAFDVSGRGEVIAGDSSLYLLPVKEQYAVKLHPFISYFKAGRVGFTPDSIIRLAKDQNHAEIWMGCNWLADQRNLVYEYRLSEKEEWIKTDKGRILMPSVKNGTTKIFVRVRLSGPVSGDGYAVLVIKRQLYFYQAPWFLIPVTALCLLAIYLLLRRRVKSMNEKLLLEKKLRELDIAFLRSRLNPHFIFNTLSSLRYLVLSGENDTASHYILRLSKLLRMVLQQSETQTVPIDDEIGLTDLYLQLESLRFNHGFRYDISKVNAPLFDIRLPSMLLQPIVENALRHGLSGSSQALKKIEVTVEYLSGTTAIIRISDNGIGISNSMQSSAGGHQSVGLQLTQQRIRNFNDTHTEKIELKFSEANSADPRNPGTIAEIIYRKPLKEGA